MPQRNTAKEPVNQQSVHSVIEQFEGQQDTPEMERPSASCYESMTELNPRTMRALLSKVTQDVVDKSQAMPYTHQPIGVPYDSNAIFRNQVIQIMQDQVAVGMRPIMRPTYRKPLRRFRGVKTGGPVKPASAHPSRPGTAGRPVPFMDRGG
ncbi:hypothetical protein Adt_03007 [Abeliophyllum distichum]|uniref:Uncharacterized protein n=1 Tax=Abeliophyllum distichum TaxID=126358 RepID=A0ABD1VXB5_9LAMI